MSLRRHIDLVARLNEAPLPSSSADPQALDRSPDARRQRARDQGFDVDDPHYHGTPGGHFDEFDPERTADEDLAYGRGVYATRDPQAASGYSTPGTSWGNDGEAEDARPTVYKVFMRVKNPFDLDKVYPFAEVKRIMTHAFDEDDLAGIEFWTERRAEVNDYPSGGEELDELQERLYEIENASDHEDVDPDQYELGADDPDYREDVESALDYEEKSVQRQIKWIEERLKRDIADHEKLVADGRIGGAYGREIYKALWQNNSEYHDWRAESGLIGGETETFEFKTWANEALAELGYDGIRHMDRYNPGKKGQSHAVTIAFKANQVRAASADFHPDRTTHAGMGESAETPLSPPTINRS